MANIAQTPGTWLKAGGFSRSDDECRKALAACGIDPDGFDSYSAVNERQAADRKELQERARVTASDGRDPKSAPHVEPCSLKPRQTKGCRCEESDIARELAETDRKWVSATGQSGHLSQDAFYNGPKGRGDPCMNYPPKPPAHSGTYGYDTRRARCMEHYGRSVLVGSPHYLVTQVEREFAVGIKPGQPVSQAQLRTGSLRSAVVAVSAGRLRMNESGDRLVPVKLDPEGAAERKKYTAAQKGVSKELKSDAGNMKNSFSGAGLSEAERIAAECIVQEWENSLAQLQSDAIAKDGVGSKASPPGSKKAQANALAAYKKRNPASKVNSWNDLSPAQKKQAVEHRQADLAAKNTGKNPFPASESGPTKDDCREYQANWLWQQQQAGSTPPMQGKAPGPGAHKSNAGKHATSEEELE